MKQKIIIFVVVGVIIIGCVIVLKPMLISFTKTDTIKDPSNTDIIRNEPANLDGWILYTSTVGKYSIKYPPQWQISKTDQFADIQIQSPAGGTIYFYLEGLNESSAREWISKSYNPTFLSSFVLKNIHDKEAFVSNREQMAFVSLSINKVLKILYTGCKSSLCAPNEKERATFQDIINTFQSNL